MKIVKKNERNCLPFVILSGAEHALNFLHGVEVAGADGDGFNVVNGVQAGVNLAVSVIEDSPGVPVR